MNPRKIVKKLIPRSLFKTVEPYGHLAEAVFFNVINGFPARGIRVIGVTGTNGKTTTSYMIHKMLVDAGYNAGLMTTVAYGVGNDIHPQLHHMTNVGPAELMKRLKYMKSKKVDWLVLETTSHALAQHRVWGVPYEIAVLTNITHEHLDYHVTFERYLEAKRQLFVLANKRGLRTGIVNADDPSADEFTRSIKNVTSYAVESDALLKPRDISLRSNGIEYTVDIDGKPTKIASHIPGSFNVSNTLAAVGVGQAIGLTPDQISKGIAALQSVEGRMTSIVEGQKASVIVDFAHTPDSFEKLFKDVRPVVKGKLIVMFGSAGRRDEAKRAVQGELAGKYADIVVVTEEDDRDCDGQAIMQDIAAGAQKAGKVIDKDLFLVHDRTEAIQFAIKKAKSKEDTVFLLGKGHEKTILRNGPDADKYRDLPQDDTDPNRVREDKWDEIQTAKTAARES